MFHGLVITGIIPYDVVWGGRLENDIQMHQFEMVSIIINLLILLVLAIKGLYIKPYIPIRIVNFILWFLMIFFFVNTIGNIFAVSLLETLIFTPITLVSAVLFYRIVAE